MRQVRKRSGNVYPDLGFRDAEAMKVKAHLTALGQDVEIVVTPARGREGTLSVTA